MAIICPDHRLLFIMVPGTGCSVVGRALIQELGGVWLPERDIVQKGQVVLGRKHNHISQLLEAGLLSPQEKEKYLIFATVRNPFDRWVTYFQRYDGSWSDNFAGFWERRLERDFQDLMKDTMENKNLLKDKAKRIRKDKRRQRILRALGFNTWMKLTLLRWYMKDRTLLSYAFPMLDGVDVVMRQELLEEGLNKVLCEAGITKKIALPRKNITPGKRFYQEYYTDSTRQFAESLLGDTLATYGYDFSGITNHQQILWLSSRT